MIEILGKVRIEQGPKTVETTATAEVLDNKVTHHQYQVGKSDALGNPIVLGQPMTYRDWLGDHVHKVYVLDVRKAVVDGNGFDQEYWKLDSEHATQEQAMTRANELLA